MDTLWILGPWLFHRPGDKSKMRLRPPKSKSNNSADKGIHELDIARVEDYCNGIEIVNPIYE